jgi:hypothetical protein
MAPLEDYQHLRPIVCLKNRAYLYKQTEGDVHRSSKAYSIALPHVSVNSQASMAGRLPQLY